jgi:(p)ppGpp synthase/HD superfamily hydrolase
MLTDRFADALAYACALHRHQTRKGVDIPYIAHLMAVSSQVLEHGGDEDQAIAGLLHDAVEDQGGLATAQVIAERFGPAVIEIVMACTDATPAEGQEKAPWRARKTAFIASIPQLPAKAALVITCDKLHNLTCLLADLDREGPATLQRFNQPDGLVWYYASLAQALSPFEAVAPVRKFQDMAQVFAGQLRDHGLPDGRDLD